MERLANKVHNILTQAFPRAEIIIRPPLGDRSVSGCIVWPGFRRLDQMARQQRVQKVLAEELTPAERRRVSIFFNFTPAEWKSFEEDRLAEEESILRTAKTIQRERAWRRKFSASLK